MFYEERVINGVLMCRGIPNGEWRQVSAEVMTQRITELKEKLNLE